MIKIKKLDNPDNFENLNIMSLGTLQRIINHSVETCKLNKIDPNNVPVIVADKANRDDYILFGVGMGMRKPFTVSLQFYGNNEDRIDYFEGEDKRPDTGGEFWNSRGPSSWDISGFVVSKEAGERLLQMVKRVLCKDECETWLDWRKHEPNWIQFKFSAKEFDVNKLHELTKNGIITEDILNICKL